MPNYFLNSFAEIYKYKDFIVHFAGGRRSKEKSMSVKYYTDALKIINNQYKKYLDNNYKEYNINYTLIKKTIDNVSAKTRRKLFKDSDLYQLRQKAQQDSDEWLPKNCKMIDGRA